MALLGVSGITVRYRSLWSAGKPALGVAVLGIVFSLAAGIALGRGIGLPTDTAVYLGLALAATSIGMTAQVFEQYGLMGTRAARIVLGAAVLDDVLALYLLSAAHGFFSGNLQAGGLAGFALVTAAVLGLIFVTARAVVSAVARLPQLVRPWAASIASAALIASAAWMTHGLGVSSIVGAFFAGMGVGEGLGAARDTTLRHLRWVVMVFAPAFFVMIGVQAQWLPAEGVALALALVVIALVSKLLGGAAGALGIRSWGERWFIGLSMVPRGEVGLIIATLGYREGHLSQSLFATVVFMVIVVSLLAPVGLARMAPAIRTATHRLVRRSGGP